MNIITVAHAHRISRLSLAHLLIAPLCALSVSASATAQPSVLTPVEQTVADVSPLGATLRQLEPDFGAPQGFDRVYTSPEYPGKFLRINGAMTAVFPQSDYVLTNNGMAPILPRNTVYYIGPPPGLKTLTRANASGAARAPRPAPGANKLIRRAPSLRFDPAGAPAPQPPAARPSSLASTHTPTPWSIEQRRRVRVAHWIALAAATDRR